MSSVDEGGSVYIQWLCSLFLVGNSSWLAMASASSISVNGRDRKLFPAEMKGINSEEGECYGDSGDLISAEEVFSHLGLKAGESTSADSDGQDESVSNLVPELVDSPKTEWTDEKHSSYLDSIEASFVKKMYDREYCSLDLCGQTPKEIDALDPDCAESRLNFPSPFNEFKIWQKCCWRTLPDHGKFQHFSFPRGVGSTWIQRFRASVSFKKQAVPVSTVDESWRNCAEKKVVMLRQPGPTSVEMAKAPNQGMHTWGHRLQSNYSGSVSRREKRKPSAAHVGKFDSAEVTDWNFKDEAKTEGIQCNAASEAGQNLDDSAKRELSPKKQKLYIDGGCKSPEDQVHKVVPFHGSANAEEAG